MRNLLIEVVFSAQKVRYQNEIFSRAITQETKSFLHCMRIFPHISLSKPKNKEMEVEKKREVGKSHREYHQRGFSALCAHRMDKFEKREADGIVL